LWRRLARKSGLRLWQSYLRIVKQAAMMAGCIRPRANRGIELPSARALLLRALRMTLAASPSRPLR
jgi:hypothetical protein